MSELLVRDKATGEWKSIPYIVGPQGPAGKDGEAVTITSISESSVDEGANVLNFSDGTSITVRNGSKGEKGDTGPSGPQGDRGDTGKGIVSIIKTSSSDLVDTYTITYTDNTTTTFTVTNGSKGEQGSNGHTPVITIVEGYWYVDGVNTNVVAIGSKGDTGDTGPKGESGEAGKDGVTPHIGGNGNWFLGETDTGLPSRGEAGYTPVKGKDYFTTQDAADFFDTYFAEKLNAKTQVQFVTWESGD